MKNFDKVISVIRVEELDLAVLNCVLAVCCRSAFIFNFRFRDQCGEFCSKLVCKLRIVSLSQNFDFGFLAYDSLEKWLTCQCPINDISHLVCLLERQKAIELLTGS